MKTHTASGLTLLCFLWIATPSVTQAVLIYPASHEMQRPLPGISSRPMAGGPARFVDGQRGNDAGEGSEKAPWKTIRHALQQLGAGDTLCLRGGTYYETIRCAFAGTAEHPITIRAFPGERVIIDGGYREFFDSPAQAWVPAEGGAPGEYRSTNRYRNITGVSGMFGDSYIGLHTYWLISDLRSTNEQWRMDPEKKIFDLDLYCGPGIWHDPVTGYIHCRLAHTHNTHPQAPNYRGETDPRKLPLVIAPLEAVPLHLAQARHLRIHDLVLRGGGRNTLLLEHCAHIEIDRLVAQCGSITGYHSGPVKLTDSAVYGRVPPWMWRIDSSKGCASGASRDIAMLVTPVLLETSHKFEEPRSLPRVVFNAFDTDRPAGSRGTPLQGEDAKSPQMMHHPRNHDWEIARCEFTDGHDGVFLVGSNIRFHHNLVESIQDDAVDISCAQPSPDDTMFISENLIRHSLSAISSHNYNVHWPRGRAFVSRNVIDQSQGIMLMRPTEKEPEGDIKSVGTFLLHGADTAEFIESVYFYHNTCIAPTMGNYAFAHRTMFHLKPGSERRVFNNIFVYLNDDGRYPTPFYGLNAKEMDIQIDGNLHWNPHRDAKIPEGYFDKLRQHPLSEFNKPRYPAGLGAVDLAGDPRFLGFYPPPDRGNDYRIAKDSPAIGRGVPLPAEWPDPLRPPTGARPDIGALPHGSTPPKVGIGGRFNTAFNRILEAAKIK